MKRIILVAIPLCLAVVFTVNAQHADPDKIETEKGILVIQPIHHGTLVLSWDGNNIYVDPTGGAQAFEGIDPDLILITDIHGDHMDVNTLDAIDVEKTIIVAPKAVADRLPDAFNENIVILNNGGSTRQLGIAIRAIPMYNLPESSDSRHTKGRGNGYVLTMGGKNIYISGDTEDIPEMRSLKNIDVAFVCMNLPYTMDVNQAASAVLEFKPKIVYPYHYRGQDTEKFRELVEAGSEEIEVRLRDWYPED